MGEKWVVRPQSLMDARILEVMRREAQILEQMENRNGGGSAKYLSSMNEDCIM